jgi:hypothetical protein
MGESQKSHRVQIIIAVIGVIGTIAAAFVSNIDWDDDSSPPTDRAESPDPLAGFYVRDGLANSPAMKIEPIGGNEYKLEVFNHPWPWEATVHLSGSELSGYGRFPKSKATMDFKGRVSGDGSIRSEYHFITKGDGSPAGGRVDTHIWTPRVD